MFSQLVFEKSAALYNNKILIIDVLNFDKKSQYSALFKEHGFEVIYYNDDLSFRVMHESKISDDNAKFIIVSTQDTYIPYDIYKNCFLFKLMPETIYPKLNFQLVKEASLLQLNLISFAYAGLFEDIPSYEKSKNFLRIKAYAKENIRLYLNSKYMAIQNLMKQNLSYVDWMDIAEAKAEIDVISATYEIDFNTNEINNKFKTFILSEFGQLSQNLNTNSPVLVSKALEYISENSKRFILIVMDGMSEFDWAILSNSFTELHYNKTSVYAMIPTTTSISRQCLLSNKYPMQLINPWSQSKEKYEYYDCMSLLGFSRKQIGYERGYEATFDTSVDCGTLIINDIDDLVHAQQQGKIGMYRDVELLTRQRKLYKTVTRHLDLGYDIYITSDHGNATATGMGKLIGTGVEIETKSKKMLVLKNFADKLSLIEKYKMIEYPKYYLNKEYDYLICDNNTSLDSKDTKVITHGGISIEEVIVPFITIKKEQNNV